ncbi:putative methyltransferase PMT27 [Artemisia annua]|uniref:Putative methyltransferase PMT27 n=1 Tax=Artemisia annua TaxID=35608 RepID=A0A2U1KVH1_ARTAN|nr:putative methyltransferase PMT27 [Artemisia annua]
MEIGMFAESGWHPLLGSARVILQGGAKKLVLSTPSTDAPMFVIGANELSEGVTQGEKVLLGGKRHSIGFSFDEPTIISDVRYDMLIARYSFGLVVQIVPDIRWGNRTRVVLDVGCGVVSFGGFLFNKDADYVFCSKRRT